MTLRSITWLTTLTLALHTGQALATASAAEAESLGSTLTAFGAEKGGNRDGSIPPYSGGLPVTTRPPGFEKSSGRWADPFGADKPRFSITGQNMDRYANQLSEASKALLKRYPSYRMDVYPSRRTVAFPASVLENTRKYATSARLTHDGLTFEGAVAAIPFPIVKTGHEAMWNHLLRYNGHAVQYRGRTWYVDAKGVAVLSAQLNVHLQSSYFNPNWTPEELKKNGNYFEQAAYDFMAPAQAAGNASITMDSLDPVAQPRLAWTYSAASRRVRIAPDFKYDTPLAAAGGVASYDERNLVTGKLDLFDYRLVGKREMFIPYNNYALLFQPNSTQILTPQHVNPDFVRWELHRVWVVEATLKKGQRHASSRRTFYFDEDWGGAGMSDAYDASGHLSKGLFNMFTQLYDVQLPLARSYWGYDLNSGIYFLSIHFGEKGTGLWEHPDGFSKLMFTPDSLAGRSGR